MAPPRQPLEGEVEPYTRLAGVYDEIVVDPCYGRWAAFLDDLWRADDDGVRTVLDVCCGTGLMAAELVALGYRVVGVDASPQMLARARRRLGPEAHLVQETLPRFTIDATFDAAVSTFDGLNYLTPAGFRSTLQALADRIRPGGWFVFDVHTDAMMEFTAANPVVSGQSHGLSFVITSIVDAGARTCDSHVTITGAGDGDAFSELHHQSFFSDRQIRAALADAAFDVVAVTDEYAHEPVTASTLRATWITRRRARAGRPRST
jgi:SAM-dependent methyltransferase